MDINFNLFIEELKNKSGINLAIFDKDGTIIAGDNNEFIPVLESQIIVLEDKGFTSFGFVKNGKQYYAILAFAGNGAEKLARLTLQLIENYNFLENRIDKDEFYNLVFKNQLNYATISKFKEIFSIPNDRCFVMLINYNKDIKTDVLNILNNYIESNADYVLDGGEEQSIFIKYLDKISEEYQSSTEYAEFLYKSIFEEMGYGITISVGGTVKSVFELAESYNQAVLAFKLAKAVSAKGNVHSFKQYTLVKILEDLPKGNLSEYLNVLLDDEGKEIFEDEEMLGTAEVFLEEDLNTSETSRKLFLHRNTLTYRLDKIEKLTGLNLRKFSDAVTFRLITLLYKLIK